jgi:hypothetical protein
MKSMLSIAAGSSSGAKHRVSGHVREVPYLKKKSGLLFIGIVFFVS